MGGLCYKVKEVDKQESYWRVGLIEILLKEMFTSKSTNNSRKRSQKCTLSLSTESTRKKKIL